MSNDSMGNLEKLGILVIVILVVVVGVVAITPSDTLLGGDIAVLPEQTDSFDQLPDWRSSQAPDTEVRVRPLAQRQSQSQSQRQLDRDPWPIPTPSDEPVDRPVRPDVEKVVNIAPDKPIPAPQPPLVIQTAPSYREVTVQKDDSLWKIAERELGAGSRWGEIARANPSVNPDRLQMGQKLRIALQDTAPSPRDARPAATTGVKTYLVKPGDTPMGVSSLHYGTVRHYRLILEHNGLAEDGLKAGTTIEIPPVPETASNVAPVRESSSLRAAPAGHRAGSAERFYEVQKGDVPGTIAREQLGDESRWHEILRINGIADSGGLIAGSRIRLPVK